MMILLLTFCNFFEVSAKPLLVAHRGAHHSYRSVVPPLACRALSGPQRHSFIENTIPSIAHAFARGADVVEIDLVATQDLQLVLSHELTLDCYTDGRGAIAHKSLKQLKAIDLGYYFTFDNKTYPFRGKGIGLMTTLTEVVRAFPGKKFLLNPKAESPKLLVRAFQKQLVGMETKNFYFWGDESIYLRLAQDFRLNKYISIPSRSAGCVESAKKFFWFGLFPESCVAQTLSLTPDQLKSLGGWPRSFLEKMQQSQGQVWLFIPQRLYSLSSFAHLGFEALIVSNIDEWRSHE